jgi:hypothetical protein
LNSFFLRSSLRRRSWYYRLLHWWATPPTTANWAVLRWSWVAYSCFFTGIVAGPLIQATGGRNLRMVWGQVTFMSGYSYHMSVCTLLPVDHTMQTKFQSQWPSDVETPVVPSIWAQKLSSIRTVSTGMGLCSSYLQGKSWSAVGFLCWISSWGIDPMHCTTHALRSPSPWWRAKIQTVNYPRGPKFEFSVHSSVFNHTTLVPLSLELGPAKQQGTTCRSLKIVFFQHDLFTPIIITCVITSSETHMIDPHLYICLVSVKLLPYIVFKWFPNITLKISTLHCIQLLK